MGKVVSFERSAVASLRERLGAAEHAREELSAFARDHHMATASIHRAVLALMEADSLDDLFRVVIGEWPGRLEVDVVSLALVADGLGFTVGDQGIGLVERRLIDRLIFAHGDVAMRSVERGNILFGAAADGVRSEAIIRMPAEAPLPYGLLLLGHGQASEIDARHTAHLLGFLGASLSAMMRRWLIDR